MPVHLGSMGESVRPSSTRQRRHDAPGRRLRAQRPLQRRHAPARRHGDRARVPRRRRHGRAGILRRRARPPRRHRRHHAGLDAAELHARRRGRRADRQLPARRGRAASARPRCARCSPRGRYPARNPDQNLADLRAQIAACAKGARGTREDGRALRRCDVVRAYMGHVQDNAEASVRRVLGALRDGSLRATRWTTARASAWRSRSTRDARAATHRLHGHEPAAADQLQRAARPSARRRCSTSSARSSTTTSR